MALVTPTPVASASLPLADPADRTTFGPRMRETLRWQREDLAPGVEQIANDAYENALHAQTQALIASSVNGYLGAWSDLTGFVSKLSTVKHGDSFWVLNSDLENVAAFEPGVSPVWVAVVDHAVDVLYDDTDTDLGVDNTQDAIGVLAQRTATIWQSIAPGMVGEFAMQTPPVGWLHANGDAVSRTTYAALFAAIGTTYGAGDGSSTFNLPDARGRVVRGWDDGAGRDPLRAFGSTQNDAIQQTVFDVQRTFGTGMVSAVSGPVTVGVGATSGGPAGEAANRTANRVTIGSAPENRVKNIAFLICIFAGR